MIPLSREFGEGCELALLTEEFERKRDAIHLFEQLPKEGILPILRAGDSLEQFQTCNVI
jgi:hypothetical protein